jgi:hypothetical protein
MAAIAWLGQCFLFYGIVSYGLVEFSLFLELLSESLKQYPELIPVLWMSSPFLRLCA